LGNRAAGRGEVMVLIGAFAIAAEILLIGIFAPRVDARRLAVVECTTLSLLCLAATLAGPGHRLHFSADWVLSAAGLGLASAGLQVSVNWAQRFIPPAHADLHAGAGLGGPVRPRRRRNHGTDSDRGRRPDPGIAGDQRSLTLSMNHAPP
jgi:hypothetical protein